MKLKKEFLAKYPARDPIAVAPSSGRGAGSGNPSRPRVAGLCDFSRDGEPLDVRREIHLPPVSMSSLAVEKLLGWIELSCLC